MSTPRPLFLQRTPLILLFYLTLFFFCFVQKGHAQTADFIQGDSVTVNCGDSATLTAIAPSLTGNSLFADFNAQSVDSGFTANPNPDFSEPCKASLDNTPYLWFGSSASSPRHIRTVDVNTDTAHEVCFELRFAVQLDPSPCEGPDMPDEGVSFAYSPNGGSTWNEIHYFNPDTLNSGGSSSSPFTSWEKYCFSVPDSISASNIRFRWYQPAGSGSNYDHWGLDNIAVKDSAVDTALVYDWGNGMTTKSDSSFLVDDSSNYSVDVIDTVKNDTATATAYVAYDAIDVGITPSAPNMCGKDSLQLQATGLSGSFVYDWSPGTALSDSTSATVWTGADSTTLYSLTVQDSLQSFCSDTASVQVDVTTPPTPSIQTDSVICGSETDTLFLTNSYDSTVWNGSYTGDTLLVDASYGTPTQKHKVTVTDSNGCSGSDTVQLTVDSTYAWAQVQNDTLWANNSSGSYQWVNCDSAFAPVTGATSQSFYPSSNGNYAVVVSSGNGCTDTSQCKSSLPNSVWSNQGSGVPGTLFSVHFVDSSKGWIATANGLILHTSDGGQNWSVQKDTSLALRSVHFATDSAGWVVGDSGTVLYTLNGGWDWYDQNSGVSADLHSVHAATKYEVWTVGDNGTSLHSSSGGATWNSQNNGSSMDLSSVHFNNVDTGWSVGASGTILRTLDGGSNWTAQSSGTSNDLNGVLFVNDTLGWTVGDNGTILRSKDAGVNWVSQLSGTNEDLQSLHFVNDSVGWIVGANGTILYTSDGRSAWLSQAEGDLHGLKDVHFAGETHGWTVGDGGTVLHMKSTSDDPSSMRTREKEGSITLYPNPTRDRLRIEHENFEGELTITLFDNVGKQLIEQTVGKEAKSSSLRIRELDAGIYFLKVSNRDGSQQAVRKVVVEE